MREYVLRLIEVDLGRQDTWEEMLGELGAAVASVDYRPLACAEPQLWTGSRARAGTSPHSCSRR